MGTRHSQLCRRSKGSGTWPTQPSTLLSGRSRINRSDQQSHCGLLKTKQSQLLFEACRGAVANLIRRRAARHRGNLTVPIKRSAAAQSNYGETSGTRRGLSPSSGPGRDPREGCPGLSVPSVPLWGAPPCSQQPGEEARGGCSSSSPPWRLSPCGCLFADTWSACSSAKKKKTLPEAKQFAGGRGTSPSVGTQGGQQHSRRRILLAVPCQGRSPRRHRARDPLSTAEQRCLVPEGDERYL